MIFSVGMAVIAFSLLMFVRNELVYRVRQRALNYTHNMAQAAISKGKPWRQFHDKLDSYGGYDKMLWQLHKWTYAQFYNGLEEEV